MTVEHNFSTNGTYECTRPGALLQMLGMHGTVFANFAVLVDFMQLGEAQQAQ